MSNTNDFPSFTNLGQQVYAYAVPFEQPQLYYPQPYYPKEIYPPAPAPVEDVRTLVDRCRDRLVEINRILSEVELLRAEKEVLEKMIEVAEK